MDLERLVTALGPLEVRGGAPTDVTDLAYDTRSVVSGALLIGVGLLLVTDRLTLIAQWVSKVFPGLATIG